MQLMMLNGERRNQVALPAAPGKDSVSRAMRGKMDEQTSSIAAPAGIPDIIDIRFYVI
jgi:hypothetical protein